MKRACDNPSLQKMLHNQPATYPEQLQNLVFDLISTIPKFAK